MFPPAPVSPRRCTCIAYADIDTVYLVFPSSPPRALFFVVTAEVIPSGRNPLPGIFRLSKHEIAHQTRGIGSPDPCPPLSSRRVLTFGYSFLLSSGIPSSLPSRLTRIATIRTILVIVVTLVTVAYSCYFVYSRYRRWLTLAGEIRDTARAGCVGIIIAFFSHSLALPIRNLTHLRFFQQT